MRIVCTDLCENWDQMETEFRIKKERLNAAGIKSLWMQVVIAVFVIKVFYTLGIEFCKRCASKAISNKTLSCDTTCRRYQVYREIEIGIVNIHARYLLYSSFTAWAHFIFHVLWSFFFTWIIFLICRIFSALRSSLALCSQLVGFISGIIYI